MEIGFYILATVFMLHGCTFLYTYLQAIIGSQFGARALIIRVGTNVYFNPITLTLGPTRYEFGVIPFLGFTKFLGQDDEASDHDEALYEEALRNEDWNAGNDEEPIRRFPELSIFGRLCVMISGPVSSIALGVVLLLVPVVMQWPQVAVGESIETKVSPVSVPHLGISGSSSTVDGQTEFVQETIVEFWRRIFEFESKEGWGGPFAWFVTCGAVGSVSPEAWISCVALICLANGLMNLLPIPSLNGGHIVLLFFEAIFGRMREPTELRITVWGLLAMLGVYAYLLSFDYVWFEQWIFG
jgi:membrane-associated protease RseP (regulator of RpoE activity)